MVTTQVNLRSNPIKSECVSTLIRISEPLAEGFKTVFFSRHRVFIKTLVYLAFSLRSEKMSSKKGKWKDSAQQARRLSQTSSSNLPRKGSLIEEETSAKELEEYLETLKKKSGIRSLWRGNSFDKVVRDDEDKTPDISISSMEDEELGKFFRIKPTIFLVTSSLLAGRQLAGSHHVVSQYLKHCLSMS